MKGNLLKGSTDSTSKRTKISFKTNQQIFTPGQTVVLDQGGPNSSLVTVIEQTPQRVETKVKGAGGGWWVLTSRLKP